MQDVPVQHLLRLAAQWQEPERDGYTYCLPPGQIPPEEAHLSDEPIDAIRASETGAILFWSPAEARLVLPPFPVESETTSPGWDTSLLSLVLERRWTVLVLLLSLIHISEPTRQAER